MSVKILEKLVQKKYTIEQIKEIFDSAIPDLIFQAQQILREYHNPNEIQFCTLSNIKTGACPEDCSYCSQSARYDTDLKVEPLMDEATIMQEATEAHLNGATRFCMGAAWREAPNNEQFDQVLRVVTKVKEMGMEPCVTLGMLSATQAQRLKEAGLHSYNHNIDTSKEHYANIIGTRTFQDRLDTIASVQAAGINVCSGGILGLGETRQDRYSFLETLANLDPQPDSVPVNVLVPIEGTPQFEESKDAIKEYGLPVDKFEIVRTVAAARILMPKARVRLSAGRLNMSDELQTLCFLAGANSIHTGEKLLTTKNLGYNKDEALLAELGMKRASASN